MVGIPGIYTQYPLAQLLLYPSPFLLDGISRILAPTSLGSFWKEKFWKLYDELVSHRNQEQGVRLRKYCEGQCDTDLLLLVLLCSFPSSTSTTSTYYYGLCRLPALPGKVPLCNTKSTQRVLAFAPQSPCGKRRRREEQTSFNRACRCPSRQPASEWWWWGGEEKREMRSAARMAAFRAAYSRSTGNGNVASFSVHEHDNYLIPYLYKVP